MAELILEPYAVVQRWRLHDASGNWGSILGEYLQALSGRCMLAGECVIGHIKALALFPDNGYLRLSVISANLPAAIEGTAPPGCSTLDLTLNILVYGLERSQIEQITRKTVQEIAEKWNVDVLDM